MARVVVKKESQEGHCHGKDNVTESRETLNRHRVVTNCCLEYYTKWTFLPGSHVGHFKNKPY